MAKSGTNDGAAALVIERTLQGDREAARELMGLLLPTVHARVARALLRQKGRASGRDVRQEVEDLVQEVFVALLADDGKLLRSWDAERGMSLKNYVGLVAQQRVGHVLRSRRRSPWTEDATQADTLERIHSGVRGGERVATSRNLLERMVEALQLRLTPAKFELFRYLYVHQLSVDEVCERTGTTPAAVYTFRTRLRKLVQELRGELEARGERREDAR